jgi:hypothetical protein
VRWQRAKNANRHDCTSLAAQRPQAQTDGPLSYVPIKAIQNALIEAVEPRGEPAANGTQRPAKEICYHQVHRVEEDGTIHPGIWRRKIAEAKTSPKPLEK